LLYHLQVIDLRATGFEPVRGVPGGDEPTRTPAGPKPAVSTDFTTLAQSKLCRSGEGTRKGQAAKPYLPRPAL
jgi:hypothetical protein